eukprot:scaffold8930_cov95-Isochrysis_galbana.AAC.2
MFGCLDGRSRDLAPSKQATSKLHSRPLFHQLPRPLLLWVSPAKMPRRPGWLAGRGARVVPGLVGNEAREPKV